MDMMLKSNIYILRTSYRVARQLKRIFGHCVLIVIWDDQIKNKLNKFLHRIFTPPGLVKNSLLKHS